MKQDMVVLHIRTALPSDRDAVIDLIHALNLFESRITGDRLTDRASARAYHEGLTRRIARQEGRMLVGEIDGQIVAALGFMVQEDHLFVRADLRRHGYVTDMIVHEDWRRRGIARMMLAEAERLARAKGLRRLVIGVVAGNEAAERVYEGYGFRPSLQTMTKSLD